VRIVPALLLTLLVLVPHAAAQPLVDRGRYLVEVIGACGNCHSPKDATGEVAGKHMAGGFRIRDDAFGVAITSNITPDRRTGIGAWTDVEIIRAIREGRGRDGRTLGPPMPYELYRDLSDAEVKAMVAYLRTLPAINNRVERSRYTVALPSSYGPPVGRVPDPPRDDLVRYGAYLAGPVAHCVECHTVSRPDGRLDTTRLLAGGRRFVGPFGASYGANITPDRETGVGAWTDAQIVAAIYGVKANGQPVLPPMPWPYYAGRIAEGDLKAMIAYLRSLPPIRNAVPHAEPPKR